jgi:hypothetical protein
LESVSSFHEVISERAKKGKLMVDRIKECYKEQGWHVDVRAMVLI